MKVFLGFDPAESRACTVAQNSIYRTTGFGDAVALTRISRLTLRERYTRPTSTLPSGQLFDDLSDAPMSTDHAIARFWVPLLSDYQGVALFTDGDVLVREDLRSLFALADPRYAVQVVQHPPLLTEGTKKTGVVQQAYPRKNWSSVILWNCAHPAHRALTPEVLNTWPGRELHAFGWLRDDEIGALPDTWNYLVGVSAPQTHPALVHFTLGTPDLPGHADDPFAEEWWAIARAAGYQREQGVRLTEEGLRASAMIS